MLGFLKRFFVLALLCAQPVVVCADSVSNEDIESFYNMLTELDWEHSSDTKRVDIFKRVNDARVKLDENMNDLQKNYDDAKANEQSLANRTLTATSMAATGLGAMELMQGLAEKNADADAQQDMAAYLSTFRCSYASGKSVKGGTDEIELPGGNDQNMMNLRAEYFALAQSLKERKTALNLKPGIESEEILDKSQTGLYDDENTGITDGAYESLYRAQMLNSEKDKAAIDAAADKSQKRVLGGAIAAGAGVLVGVVGNILINKNTPKDKSKELLSERERIASDLNDVMNEVIEDCNKNISDLKNNIPSESEYVPAPVDDDPGMSYSEYVKMINDLQPIANTSDIERIKDIPACK